MTHYLIALIVIVQQLPCYRRYLSNNENELAGQIRLKYLKDITKEIPIVNMAPRKAANKSRGRSSAAKSKSKKNPKNESARNVISKKSKAQSPVKNDMVPSEFQISPRRSARKRASTNFPDDEIKLQSAPKVARKQKQSKIEDFSTAKTNGNQQKEKLLVSLEKNSKESVNTNEDDDVDVITNGQSEDGKKKEVNNQTSELCQEEDDIDVGDNADEIALQKKTKSLKNSVQEPESTDSEDEEKDPKDDPVLQYVSLIKFPRSQENIKYEAVYNNIPMLRSASPPRFTTKGIKKKHIDHEALGVRKLGKTLGNPFSNYGKRRNGIVFGNKELETESEKKKYAEAAKNVKRIMEKKNKEMRYSSYVPTQILEQVRESVTVNRRHKTVKKENGNIVEEEVEVDIETIDDSNQCVAEDLKNTQKKKKTGRRPGRTILECEDCGYKTTHSGHMRTHIMCVHKDFKMHECQYEGCNYKCSRKGSMTRHEKCVHRKDKVFRCDYEGCDFASPWYISLGRHIVTKHEKLRPWTCQVCQKSFGQQYTLDSHINSVHKKLKRIKCAFCTFRSCTKMSVRAHILRRHKEEISQAMNEAEEEENSAQSEEEKTEARKKSIKTEKVDS